jgi:hypothetical protein
MLKTANIKFVSSRTYSAWRTSWYCRPYTEMCFVLAFSVPLAELAEFIRVTTAPGIHI